METRKGIKRGDALSKERILELYGGLYPPQPKSKNFVLQQARPDEEIFVLRDDDESAPWIILEWIKENFFMRNEDKLRSAFESALRMKKLEDERRKRRT